MATSDWGRFCEALPLLRQMQQRRTVAESARDGIADRSEIAINSPIRLIDNATLLPYRERLFRPRGSR